MIGLYDVPSSSPRWRHITIGEQNKKEVKKGWPIVAAHVLYLVTLMTIPVGAA